MLDKTQTIEKLRSSRQYLDEHYGVHSMMLFGSLAKGLQHEDSDVDVCVEMVPNLFKQAGIKVYLNGIEEPDVFHVYQEGPELSVSVTYSGKQVKAANCILTSSLVSSE